MEKKTDLSAVHAEGLHPVAPGKRVGVVTSEWNPEITGALRDGCLRTLEEYGVRTVHCVSVPGSFELPFAAQQLIRKEGMDAVICLGCIIQGETRHFEFIAQACAQGIMQVGLDNNTPVIFGVLTTQDMAQARDRAGGAHGNKGVEAACTCIKMLSM
ncbi:MAG: 6,7-dimethyl-8-ribityllumazine synthase [Bacteroidales bacterium]|nr:6,7-dimethyl-8-ribityllumazine synthase [Bacteroidales bacterium]MBP5396835.1 6,7-dimethyl-8-ribityllumazine synthase [Bacteroidales bacterium]MBP5613312.1 6,7-dimethyl-8-ribityllumazine synthase [Bacteroidales bacterium]